MRPHMKTTARLAAIAALALAVTACADLAPEPLDTPPAPADPPPVVTVNEPAAGNDGERSEKPQPRADGGTDAPAGPASVAVGEATRYAFSCSGDEAAVAASGAPHVTQGDSTIYIGTQQVSANNQDPRIVRFDDGQQAWCRSDLERNGDDGRGYGLLWAGDTLYGVFSATGTQGEPSGDLRRFTGDGWLTSYSDASPRGGGGPKASAIIQLDPATGDGMPGRGTYLTAEAKQKTNSLVVTDLALTGDTLTVSADSWYSPRGSDRRPLDCSGSSPFATTFTFSADLTTVTDVQVQGCS
jgi:hypothetical protein